MPEFGTDSPRSWSRIYRFLLMGVLALASLALVASTHEPKSAISSSVQPKTVSVPQMAGAKSEVELLLRGKSFSTTKRRVILSYSGEITEILVKEGSEVHKDQTLAAYRLDRDAVIHVQRVLYPEAVLNLKRAVSDYQVQIEKCDKVSLPLKKMDQERLEKQLSDVRELYARKMASLEAVRHKEQELDSVNRQIFDIQQSRKQSETSLAKAREDLRYHEEKQKREQDLLEWQTNRSYDDSHIPLNVAFLKAPIAGHVIWMSPDLRVTAELPKGAEALMIAPQNLMVVRCKVHELDLVKLRPGDQSTVIFDALPNKKYASIITRLPFVSRNSALEVPADYEVECRLENPEGGIKDGLTCNVTVRVAQ